MSMSTMSNHPCHIHLPKLDNSEVASPNSDSKANTNYTSNMLAVAQQESFEVWTNEHQGRIKAWPRAAEGSLTPSMSMTPAAKHLIATNASAFEAPTITNNGERRCFWPRSTE
eukprot:scaffold66659_cov33-Cyclotella_meneghiniana.AAC.1